MQTFESAGRLSTKRDGSGRHIYAPAMGIVSASEQPCASISDVLGQSQFGYGRREKVFRLRLERYGSSSAGAARQAESWAAPTERASTRVVPRAFQALLSRVRLPLSAPILALALTGCATTQTRYVSTSCLSQQQLEQLKAQEPGKVHSELTGNADRDTQILAGNLIRVRAWGDGLISVLSGCTSKQVTGAAPPSA